MELVVFYANGTQFAQIHSNRRVSSMIKNIYVPSYWNRKRIAQGFLTILEISEADNRTTAIDLIHKWQLFYFRSVIVQISLTLEQEFFSI